MKKTCVVFMMILLFVLPFYTSALAAAESGVIDQEGAVSTQEVLAENYVLTNHQTDGCDPVSQKMTKTFETLEQSNGADVEYIFNLSMLLSEEEWEKLESRAADISNRQHCGVYFIMLDDYTAYGEGSVFEVTYQLYHSSLFGLGDGRDGIVVLLSMEERDYAMFVYGEYAEYAFDEFGQEKLEERFLEDFGHDDWYGGISNYLNACDEFLTRADGGNPVRPSYLGDFVMMTGIGCLVAGAVCFWLLRNMKTARPKYKADGYVAKGGLHLTSQYDRFSHTTVTRTKIQEENSGNGSTHRETGGGGSGRSGKF